jgi:hypothetical protein
MAYNNLHSTTVHAVIVKNVSVNVFTHFKNMLLAGLWYAHDVRKYGYYHILRPVGDDLK